MKNNLVIFAKSPIPGHAKTRLGARIGDQASAGVYARILYQYLLNLAANQNRLSFSVTLSLASPEDVPFFASAFPEFEVRAQCEGNLGDRMMDSFNTVYRNTTEKVVLTGSDIPGMNFHIIQHAFSALEHHDVVLGPAADGGYYLIAMNAPGYPLFSNISWSTATVLDETLQLIDQHKLSVKLLPEKSDLDTIKDYQNWKETQPSSQEKRKKQWKTQKKKVWTIRN